MSGLIFILLIAALAVFVWGAVKLFRKGQRRRGLVFIAGSFGIFLLSLVVVDFVQERDAIAAGYASYEEQQAAEDAEQERRIAELLAQRDREAQEERDRLDALAREHGYENHAAQQAAELAVQRAAEQAERDRLAQERAEREAAERAAQEAAEAAAQAEEDARQTRLAAKTVEMAEGVFEVMRMHYDLEPEANSIDGNPCREDGYCDFRMGSFRVQIYGAGIAEVESTSQALHSTYREVCAAVFSGISGAQLDHAAGVIEQTFQKAANRGEWEFDMLGVEIKVSPDLNNILQCRFFKF